jgi:hypothetical protein
MSDNEYVDPDDATAVTAGGSSTDQYVTGDPETGSFITDRAPTADTPATGSSNAGINATGANRDREAEGAGNPDAG